MDSNSMTSTRVNSGDGAMHHSSPTLKTEHPENDIEARAGRSPSESGSLSPSKGPQGSRIGPRVISDAILGLSDGLTVPFALTAGLSTFGNSKLVVLGGLAELIAGAISMGLGGFVGAKSEARV